MFSLKLITFQNMMIFLLLLETTYGQLTTLEKIEETIDDPRTALEDYKDDLNVLEHYRVEIVDELEYIIKIRIDPCRGREEGCCQGNNEGACQDNLIITAGGNLPIAWSFNNYILQCNNEFAALDTCGTFIEIHRLMQRTPLVSYRILEKIGSGFNEVFLFTKGLCAGPYELWWVLRTRNGQILQYVKPFFIIEPS